MLKYVHFQNEFFKINKKKIEMSETRHAVNSAREVAAIRFGGHSPSSSSVSRERLPSAAGIVPERLV